MLESSWIGTSWKMNKSLDQALKFSDGLLSATPDSRIQPFVMPPFTSIRQVKKHLAHTNIKVGAQNMHWAEEGAWTGEISPSMLVDCSADMVELGHSERRSNFGETNETVGLKTEAAIRHGLIPLICIGETELEMEKGQADEVLREQVEQALAFLSKEQKSSTILFAYEPVWAIGEHGRPATSEYANERHRHIIDVASETTGQVLPCLYGGSVNLENSQELITQPFINGLFIGRSAWDVNNYLRILQKCSAVIRHSNTDSSMDL